MEKILTREHDYYNHSIRINRTNQSSQISVHRKAETMDGVGNKMAKKPKTAATFKSDLGGLHRSFVDICNTPKVVTKWVLEAFQKLAYQKLGREYVDQFALQFVTKVRHWIRELGKHFDDDAEQMLKTISPTG